MHIPLDAVWIVRAGRPVGSDRTLPHAVLVWKTQVHRFRDGKPTAVADRALFGEVLAEQCARGKQIPL